MSCPSDKLAERQSLMIPAEDPDFKPRSGIPPLDSPARDAILQPPRPQIQPSGQVLERAASRDASMEAAG
jgi:hypothetical protein